MTTDLSGHKLDTYALRQRLRTRAESSLYRGHDSRSNTAVFLEIAHTTTEEDAALAGRFRRRMETVSQLKHGCIAPVRQIGTSDGRMYAVIEYRQGRFMDERLAEWRQLRQPHDPAGALRLIQQLASALAVAHPAGIIHQHLAPENIYLLADDTPWLIDLGLTSGPADLDLSVLRETQELTYVSPEQLQGQALSGRGNVYSLGVILYELLAGHRPRLPLSEWDIFDRHSLPKEEALEDIRPGLSRPTYQVVKSCLWQQEWNRYDTMEGLIAALELAVGAERRNISKPEPDAAPTISPLTVVVAVIALLVIFAVLAFFLLR